MNKEIDFETNLIISYGKFEIFLLDIKNHKNIYQEEFKFRDVSEKLDFNLLNEFLENNIFKIEKLAGNFINKINIVIENKSILTSNISIKKKNYTGEITSTILKSMLSDMGKSWQCDRLPACISSHLRPNISLPIKTDRECTKMINN